MSSAATRATSSNSSGCFSRIGAQNLKLLIVLLILVAIFGTIRSDVFFLAIGGNPTVARLARLPIRRHQIAIYAMSGTPAGLVAMVMASCTMTGHPA